MSLPSNNVTMFFALVGFLACGNIFIDFMQGVLMGLLQWPQCTVLIFPIISRHWPMREAILSALLSCAWAMSISSAISASIMPMSAFGFMPATTILW